MKATMLWLGVGCIFVGTVGTVSCASGECRVRGLAISEVASAELLALGGDAVSHSGDAVSVYVEETMHWDMDGSCRVDELRQVAVGDSTVAGQVVAAVREDVSNSRAMEAWHPTCVQSVELFHVFIEDRKLGEATYVLIKPCRDGAGLERASMAGFTESGSVSVRNATTTMALIRELSRPQ